MRNEHDGITGDKRVEAEMEIDCFFVQINKKLGLGLQIEEAKIENLNPKLKSINKEDLLKKVEYVMFSNE